MGVYIIYLYNPCKWNYFTPLCRIFTTFLCCLIDSAVKCLGLFKNHPTKQLEIIFSEKLKWLAVKRYVSMNAIHSTPYLQNRVVHGGYSKCGYSKYTSPIQNFGNRKMIYKLKKKGPVFQGTKYVLFVGFNPSEKYAKLPQKLPRTGDNSFLLVQRAYFPGRCSC